MAIAMIFDATGVTQQQYDQVCQEVHMKESMPDGMLSHVAGPSENGFNVVEVWESEDSARKFFEEKLGAALKRANISTRPRVFPVLQVFDRSPK